MIFLSLAPKAKAASVKISKWDYIKLKASAHQRKPSTTGKAADRIGGYCKSYTGPLTVLCFALLYFRVEC